MSGLQLRWIGRLDRSARIVRLLRLTWWVQDWSPREKGYKLTVGLRPRLLEVNREERSEANGEWILTLAGVRLHWRRSVGGRFA
jgi:hypothetical protein